MPAPHVDPAPRWCDRVAVERALNGKPVGRPLHRAEMLTVARTVLGRGGTISETAKLLHMSYWATERLLIEAKFIPARKAAS